MLCHAGGSACQRLPLFRVALTAFNPRSAALSLGRATSSSSSSHPTSSLSLSPALSICLSFLKKLFLSEQMATTQKIKSTLNSWATLETPPSRFQRYLPEKLKAQLGHIFPFAYPRIGERVNSAFLRALGAEFLGTMLFMFVLVSQIVFSCRIGDADEGLCKLNLPDDELYMPIAATAGFTMFALIYATASFSGGRF